VIREEEASFLPLDQGLQLLDKVIAETDEKLTVLKHLNYTILWFPIDLTALILRERGFSLDEAGFDKAMKEQKSRSLPQVSTDDWKILVEGNTETFVG
jgi:alanyl-tRNA synthetase